ncbi:ABC transporter substrate-binding protein [Streptomyces sp. NPDC102274]|uniref:ABC transporter substrate-binding protein n=1 Tax=Streptomyces sp. NPDC102274 TaxID=3366151 RepID=UPI00381D8A3B
MAAPQLRTVTRTQGNNEALKTGEVVPRGFRFDFEEVPVLVDAFRRMVRGLEFDISEMALTTYLVAKAHGVRFTALPVFLVRGFHHGAILRDPASDIRVPRDLEGRRVGVQRGYTVTTGVWARAVLRDEYGVDPGRVRWVLSGDEHVSAYRPPENVEPMAGQRSLAERVLDGELAAVIGAVSGPDAERLTPLIPHPEEAGFTALRERGFYPVNHLVVVRDELLAERPELGAEVFDAFARAKQLYTDRLREGVPARRDAADLMYGRVMETTGADPLPYGIGPNRAVLETLIRHAVDQRILDRAPVLEELFAESTLGLEA